MNRCLYLSPKYLLLTVAVVTLTAACNSSDFTGGNASGGSKNGTRNPGSSNGTSNDPNNTGANNGNDPNSGNGGNDNLGNGDGGNGGADNCAKPSGSPQSSVTLKGEDWPGNGLLGGPDRNRGGIGDYDDYTLTVSGNLLVEGNSPSNKRIAVARKGTVTVSYNRGTTACNHNFTFVMKRCANKDSSVISGSEKSLAIGISDSGSTTVNVPEDGVYFDVIMTVTGSSRRDFGGCAPTPLFPQITNRLYGGYLGNASFNAQ